LTKGKYKYDYGDIGKQTPLIKMHSLGADFIPQADYAGGLRYHGMAPIISLLKDQGVISAKAFSQKEIFEAGRLFSRTEGIIPAPETCHAIKAAIDEAMDAKKKGMQKNIIICFSGHGLLDLQGYADVLNLKG
jgi:tryptophan synthase beta chain